MRRESENLARKSTSWGNRLALAGRAILACAAVSTSILFAPGMARADGESGVLLELFTSQGCYSCPPADKLLGQLAQQQGVIALSLNVDYWDYLGWKDPLAKKAYTKRQYGYVSTMRKRGPFTPQLVVQGQHSVVGSHASKVRQALEASSNDDGYVLDLARQNQTVTIALAAQDVSGEVEVLAAPYRKAVRQEIPRGENGGKTLTYHNVALEVRRLGRFSGGEASFSTPLPEAADGVAVWVQKTTVAGPFGPVRAASKLEF